MGSFRFHRADIFFAFKARSMPVSFRGPQKADDEGKRQGFPPIKYAVKQEDFIGGEGFGAFGLDVTLIVCRPLPEDKETDIDSEP